MIDLVRKIAHPFDLNWDTWNKNPAKWAVVRAIVSCQSRIYFDGHFCRDVRDALAQDKVWFYLSIFIGRALLNTFQVILDPRTTFQSLSRNPYFWRSPVGDVTEGAQ